MKKKPGRPLKRRGPRLRYPDTVYPVGLLSDFGKTEVVAVFTCANDANHVEQVNGVITDHGRYTIVEEKDGWGKLSSGAGWIKLSYTKKI